VISLAAAISRDAPLVGSEDCAGEPEEEERTPTTALRSASSSADGSEMGDGVLVNTIDEEMGRQLEKSQHKKARRCGQRPNKQQREEYQALAASLEDMVRQDHSFSVESFPLPQYVLNNDKLRARLVARVEAARPAVW
jgi:hypothetical protein